MDRHVALVLILGLVMGTTAVWWTYTASAQSGAVDYTLFVPDALRKDAIDGKIMVLRGGANIREAVKIVSSNGGFFAFLDPDNKTGLYFFQNNEPNEIEVYRYLPGQKEFGLMDCANIWGDTETPDVSTGIMAAYASGFTVSDFLKYYDCKPVDSWYWAADDVPYAGEDIEPQAQAKKAQTQLEIAYSASERVNFSDAATAVVVQTDKGTSTTTTPTQQELIISPGIQLIPLTNSKANISTAWNATTSKLATSQYVFTIAGVERYILDIWHFKKIPTKDTYEIGARAYLIEKGKAVKTWDYATYSPAFDTDGKTLNEPRQVLADSKTGILDIENTSTASTIIFSTSTGSNKSRGDVVLTMALGGSTLQMGIDFTEDKVFDERSVIRFRLSEETFQKIVALPDYQHYATDKSKLYTDGKLKLTLVSTGNPDVVLDSTIGAAPIGSLQDKYYRSDITQPVKPGKYTMKINLEGYKEIKTEKIVNWDDLSTPVINTQLFVKDLTIKESFARDYCSACNDLVSCLACVDNAVLTSYER